MSFAHISIEPLAEERILEAWPVLLMSGAQLTPDWWLNEASALLARGGGILVARAIDGSVHGIATYEAIERSKAMRLLEVERLITFELKRSEPTRAALCDCLEIIALEKGCSRLVLRERSRRSTRRERQAGN